MDVHAFQHQTGFFPVGQRGRDVLVLWAAFSKFYCVGLQMVKKCWSTSEGYLVQPDRSTCGCEKFEIKSSASLWMILEFGTKIWIQASFQGFPGTSEYLDIVSHCLNSTRTLSLDIECPPNHFGTTVSGTWTFRRRCERIQRIVVAKRGECNV